jgi:tripeptidyl-peptidase-1
VAIVIVLIIPYSVTAVGGTTNVPEVAVSRFFSGGGFSDYVSEFYCSDGTPSDYLFKFKRPAYQEQAVQDYLKALPKGTYAGLFNP